LTQTKTSDLSSIQPEKTALQTRQNSLGRKPITMTRK
jgi:hypothetical protein